MTVFKSIILCFYFIDFIVIISLLLFVIEIIFNIDFNNQYHFSLILVYEIYILSGKDSNITLIIYKSNEKIR